VAIALAISQQFRDEYATDVCGESAGQGQYPYGNQRLPRDSLADQIPEKSAPSHARYGVGNELNTFRMDETVEQLKREIADLRLMLQTAIEHGDAVEHALQTEISERKRAESYLQAILSAVVKPIWKSC